ncbi:HpcH/HpaI aldolase family protein [Devosia sp. A449]
MSLDAARPTPIGRRNRKKQMIAAGEIPLGVLLSVSSPRLVEICALAGADFVIADTEHHPFDWEGLENIVRACEATGITPGVRTMDSDGGTICRLLDIGFQYITVPHVETAAEAQAIVDAALYPPMGKRGVDLTRFSGFGLGMSARDYLPIANQEVLISVIIETVTGLENAEAIAATPGINSIGVGPTDLSTSMGLAGDHHHPDVLAATERIHGLARKHGLYFGGTPLAPEEIPALVAGGAQTIIMSISRIIGTQIRALSGAIRAVPTP